MEAPAREVTTAAGWHLHLDALATILSGGEVDIAHPEDLFAPIHQAYTDRYGPGPEPGDNATPQASEADSSSSARRRGREPTRSPRGSPG